MNKKFKYVFLFVIAFAISSCSSRKNLTYFNQLNEKSISLVNQNFEPLIQTGDILYVGITSADPLSSLEFNSSNVQPAQAGAGAGQMALSVTTGVLVGADGNIEIHKIGRLLAKGKTKTQLTKDIQQKLLPYLKEPVVNIRFMNYRVTVLGEVNRPATINITNESVSILEALGLCGDLTPYGNRKNVLLIHENNGVKEFYRLNLNDSSIFNSPHFYLQSNDVLYVEPNNTKAYSTSQTAALLPALISSATLLVLLFQNFLK
jgi:polysaccharide export outer membrane protein